MPLSEMLTKRGFVHQYSAETLAEITDREPRTVYLGVDPTADSIHAGNLALYMLLRHFAAHGHKVILIVGGGTGMIGDPKPDVERPLTPPDEVAVRVAKLKAQAEKLLGNSSVTFINNFDWLGTLNLIDFLRDIGKHFTVNALVKKDAIAARLESEEGISYTEFAYPLLQAYDFWHLFKAHGCTVQIGGSDQWGNITAGVDLIRRKEGATAYAVTVPLVIDKATGKKFGKSEGNAVWLDPEKTTPFAFYQFWLSAADESVRDYLCIFTSLPLEEIDTLMSAHKEKKSARAAQSRLAHEVTKMVHGTATADACTRASEILFSDVPVAHISPLEREVLRATAPTHEVSAGMLLADVLVALGFASSKREARQFIQDGAVHVGATVPREPGHQLSAADFTDGVTTVKRGKRLAALLVWR